VITSCPSFSSVAECGVNGEPSYNCKSEEYFYLHHDKMNIINNNNEHIENSSPIDFNVKPRCQSSEYF